MIPFITYRETDREGVLQYYILQRDFPHYIGRISPYPIENPICQSPIAGYNLWVCFAGTIRGNIIPSYPSEKQNMIAVFESMATWFYANRIISDEKKYKKYKI